MAIWKIILPAKGAFPIKALKERSLLVFLNNRIIGASKPDRSATAPDLSYVPSAAYNRQAHYSIAPWIPLQAAVRVSRSREGRNGNTDR